MVASLTAVIVAVPLLLVPPASAGVARTSATVTAQTTAKVVAATPVALKKKPQPWRPTPGAKFNVPRVGGPAQFRLEQQVIDAIRHARRKSTIKMVMFSFDRFPVTDALIKARRNRKVHVQVIVNGHEMTPAQRKLRKALGTNRKRQTFFYQCKASCRGQGDVQHSKFVLFSQTGGAKNVVMLGSLNMKLNGAFNQFNDLLTINDNKKLYTVLDGVYVQMARDRMVKKSYLDVKIGKRGTYELFVLPFPRKGAATKRTKWTLARDPIFKILAPVKCMGANTDSGRTIIRVNMHAWDGERGFRIAQRFRDLHAAGCDVQIQVGYAGGRVRQVFANPTARGKIPVRSTGFDTDDDGEIDLYSHEKILLINGRYGKTNRKVVVTGSSNYQDGGQYGDEIILRKFDFRLYRQYADNWGWSWRNHTHAFGESAVPPDAEGRRSAPMLVDGLGINSPEWRNE